jgi:N-acetylmuramoyl-L-alanine amidase
VQDRQSSFQTECQNLIIKEPKMAQIFLSAGHGGFEDGSIDPGAINGSTTEAEEMKQTRDLIEKELNSRSFAVLSVPDHLSLRETIAWINNRANRGDVAVEIHADSATPNARGASAFFIAGNNERQADADILLTALLSGVGGVIKHGTGVKPDTEANVGSLGFCRKVVVPSVLMELGFVTNTQDLSLLQTKRQNFAEAISTGLIQWSEVEVDRQGLTVTPTPTTPPNNINIQAWIDVNIFGQLHNEKGILVNGNSYIPIDLVDRLEVDVSQDSNVRRINHQNIIYARAIDLEKLNISVKWDSSSRTVTLDPIPRKILGQIDQIMSQGHTSDEHLKAFLENSKSDGLSRFPELHKLYREEASIEGVNHDIAFCQMCLETGFLGFGGDVDPDQNNFCGLGTIGGGVQGASFPDARTGIRAHIQHLKAYASKEPLVLPPPVDPRFNSVQRGIAPSVKNLSGRWAIDPGYGDSIMALLRRLYKIAGLL